MSTVRATNFQNAGSASVNMTLDTAGNATVANTLAMGSSFLRNRIINGDMRIDQRNAGTAVTPAAATYFLDRWCLAISQASKIQVGQNLGSVTPPAGFKSYLGAKIDATATVGTGDYFTIYQAIEGFNAADLDFGTANAKTITLSFWVYSSVSGTFGGALRNNAANRSYPFSYTINSTSTWEQKTITIVGDTTGTWTSNNSIGIQVFFDLGTGATYRGASGAWAAAAYNGVTGSTSLLGTLNANWYITGVQLEVGTVATPFERRQYGQELALCQRYYTKSYDLATSPGTATAVGIISGSAAGVSNTGLKTVQTTFLTQMRAVPTITTYDSAGTSGVVSGDVAGPYSNGLTGIATNVSERAFLVYSAAPPSTYAIVMHYVASAEL